MGLRHKSIFISLFSPLFLILLFSSLLIVYEGYEESAQSCPTDDMCSPREHDINKIKPMEEDSHSGGNCSYDADASNDSIELNLSLHEDSDHAQTDSNQHRFHEQSQQQCHRLQALTPHSTHQNNNLVSNSINSLTSINIAPDKRAYGESAVRGASAAPFVPINEETVFLDADPADPITSTSIHTMSSPISCDSWMNYSSNSSDDLSAISDRMHAPQTDSSEESSLEFDSSVATAQSTPKNKRNFDNVLLNSNGENSNQSSDGTGSQPSFSTRSKSMSNISDHDEPNCIQTRRDDHSGGQSKRLRGKDSISSTIASGSSSTKRKSVLHRNSSLTGAICDVRMIDFAHTTFMRRNIDTTLSTSTSVQHQGPDNGFLRGIESLTRLLNEILSEQD